MGDSGIERQVPPTSSAVAGVSVVPVQQGLIVGGVVFGVISYVVILIVGDRSGIDVALFSFSAVFFAVAWGGPMGWWIRSRQLSVYGGRPHASRPAAVDPRRAFAGGVLRVAVMALVLAVFYPVYGRGVLGTDELIGLIGFLPGGLIGLSIATAVGLRGLRRWQDEHGLEVFTRRGARRFAWTGAQARDQLVVVPASR